MQLLCENLTLRIYYHTYNHIWSKCSPYVTLCIHFICCYSFGQSSGGGYGQSSRENSGKGFSSGFGSSFGQSFNQGGKGPSSGGYGQPAQPSNSYVSSAEESFYGPSQPAQSSGYGSTQQSGYGGSQQLSHGSSQQSGNKLVAPVK